MAVGPDSDGGAGDLLLDVSRTLSRIGAGGDSGVDRVERAYIRHLMQRGGRVFFLARVLRGAALFDAAGMAGLLAHSDDPASLPGPDLLGRLARRQSPALRRAESAARRLSLGWAPRARVSGLIGRHLRPGFCYVNTGHTHLEEPHLRALRAAGAGRIAVMVHDVIPLDYPEYSRPEAPARFERLLRGAAQAADLLIYNSEDTAARADAWLRRWGLAPRGVTALLGVDPLPESRRPGAAGAKAGERPCFVTLGTIEPRKNHLLLLSLWRRMHDSLPEDRVPHLHIVGRRGWENENIVDVLDRAPFMGRSVFEHGYLPDAELAGLLAGARALLFPSFAEGFGYPLAEAVQMGVPAICSDLPVYREIVGDAPVYLDPLDGPGWLGAIHAAAEAGIPPLVKKVALPSWDRHFHIVFRSLYL